MIWKRIQNEGTETNPRFKCMEEGFMDSIKSGWRKIKKAFADRPLVQLVDGDGQEEFGYIHDLDKKRGTCSIILAQDVNENAVAASVAAAMGARSASKGYEDYEEEYPYEPLFKKGEQVHLVGAEEELGSNDIRVEILGFSKSGNRGIYRIKLLGSR